MLETMYVRCTHCGYDNSPEYRFCGMCGASLAHPPVATKPAEKPVPSTSSLNNGGNGHTENVHGPSFLGLAEDPKVEFHYLYEDEQPRSRVGLVLFLLIILGAAGYLGWQWQHNGFPFNRLNASGPSNPSGSPSEVAPAQTQDQSTHTDKPMTGAGDVLPTQPDQKKQPDTSKTTEVPVENGQAGQPTTTAAASSAKNESNAGSEKATEKEAEQKPDQENTTEEAKATPPEVPAKARTPKPRAAKPAPSQPATTTTPTSPDADLELAGERYLYGNGLPQNCTRAESNLRTAATHGNSKAQTVLGTMYATGHCVGRDLPTAYRWFARALHQEPQNTRISADLQVLWRQMTPQERQLATGSAQ
jgi:zinc ribbon protein/Sel1 repeat-containing protein